MIILYCIASALIGAWVSSFFRKKEIPQEIELPYEQFDPLETYRENRRLRDSLESLRSKLERLEVSNKFYTNKVEILQRAVREKNNEFVIHELQRLNYDEDSRPFVTMSGFATGRVVYPCETFSISE